jgi:hypothetical protein
VWHATPFFFYSWEDQDEVNPNQTQLLYAAGSGSVNSDAVAFEHPQNVKIT